MACFLTIEQLGLSGANLRQPQVVDEVHDLLECRFDNRPAGTGNAEPQDRALPKILIPAFSNRYVELIYDPPLNPLEHPPLALQGMILRKYEPELKYSDDHGRRGLGMIGTYRLTPTRV